MSQSPTQEPSKDSEESSSNTGDAGHASASASSLTGPTEEQMRKAVKVACMMTGINKEEIHSRNRSGKVAFLRQMLMAEARHQGWTLQAVASFFKRDHSTVIHAIKTVEQTRKKSGEETNRKIDSLIRKIRISFE